MNDARIVERLRALHRLYDRKAGKAKTEELRKWHTECATALDRALQVMVRFQAEPSQDVPPPSLAALMGV